MQRPSKSDPKRLSLLLRGELDWIVMKALDKDRNRRYESASALGDDVQRYLNNEAVQAFPPSRCYRIRKFVRRHKRAVNTTAVVVALLALLVGSLAWGALLVSRDPNRRVRGERGEKDKGTRWDIAVKHQSGARETRS